MRRYILLFCLVSCLNLFIGQAAPSVHHFEAGKGSFLLDGKAFVIKAAELHYARIPSDYWEHRIEMCKALGMNTICLYVFWNYHEEEEGVFHFEGERDLAKFLALCQKHDMWVILRPGPYVCAEWEMGGLPWWLLKKENMELRSQNEDFMQAVGRFQRRLAQELSPFMMKNGGNILMVQVENEFGSYGQDKAYMSALRDTLRSVGWEDTPLFQCDWSSNFQKNALDDLIWTLNFGTNAKPLQQFRTLREIRPDAPLMCSEYWSGWFDGWGRKHETRSADAMVKGIASMLENNISFSLYMTHGGTSFAHWAGANNTHFSPDCTSYDYDAPINEQGSANDKYHKLRALLQEYSDKKMPEIPSPKPIIQIADIDFVAYAPLESTISRVEKSRDPLNFEAMDFAYGSAIYTCRLPACDEGYLRITDAHDFVRVFVNDSLVGELYRGLKDQHTLKMPATQEGDELRIFVEAMGRINYSRMIHDRKGITEKVELISRSASGHELCYTLKNWEIQLIDARDLPEKWEELAPNQPRAAYYKGSFRLKKSGDTFLDLSSWGKGFVWVNGHCLGRFWNVGPQQTLYCPGCWLKKGENEVIVMDIIGPQAISMQGLKTPIIDQLHKEYLPQDAVNIDWEDNEAREALMPSLQGNDAAPGAR